MAELQRTSPTTSRARRRARARGSTALPTIGAIASPLRLRSPPPPGARPTRRRRRRPIVTMLRRLRRECCTGLRRPLADAARSPALGATALRPRMRRRRRSGGACSVAVRRSVGRDGRKSRAPCLLPLATLAGGINWPRPIRGGGRPRLVGRNSGVASRRRYACQISQASPAAPEPSNRSARSGRGLPRVAQEEAL